MEPDVAGGGGGGDPGHCGLGGRGREMEDWRLASGPPGPLRPPRAGPGMVGCSRKARGALFHTLYVRGQPPGQRLAGSLHFLSWSSRTACGVRFLHPVGQFCVHVRPCVRLCVCVRAPTWCEHFWPNWHFSRAAKELLKMQNHNPQKPITQAPHTIPFSFPLSLSSSFLKK